MNFQVRLCPKLTYFFLDRCRRPIELFHRESFKKLKKLLNNNMFEKKNQY